MKRRRKQMKKNMGMVDRIIRIVLAILIGVLYLAGAISGAAAVILGIIAIAFLITGFVGFCPVYLPFKISTRAKSKEIT
jgi:amino acid transporter